MECGAMANWLNRWYCHLGNSYVDELVAYIVLVVFCLAMMVGLIKTFIEITGERKQSRGPDTPGGADSIASEE